MLLTITERSWVKGETKAGFLDFAESCHVGPLLYKKKSPLGEQKVSVHVI